MENCVLSRLCLYTKYINIVDVGLEEGDIWGHIIAFFGFSFFLFLHLCWPHKFKAKAWKNYVVLFYIHLYFQSMC